MEGFQTHFHQSFFCSSISSLTVPALIYSFFLFFVCFFFLFLLIMFLCCHCWSIISHSYCWERGTLYGGAFLMSSPFLMYHLSAVARSISTWSIYASEFIPQVVSVCFHPITDTAICVGSLVLILDFQMGASAFCFGKSIVSATFQMHLPFLFLGPALVF